MKKLDIDSQGDTNKYLIERAGELDAAIDHFKIRIGGLEYMEAAEILTSSHTWFVTPIPTVYPYVVVVDGDDERDSISLTFVKPSAFTALPDDPSHLYEFSIRRKDLNSPYRVHETKYQVVALDIFEAHVKLGQTYYRDEEYELEVISWQQVR